MDKGLIVTKWVLINWLKIPQMKQDLIAQFACPSPKVLDFNEKRLHLASVVRVYSNKRAPLTLCFKRKWSNDDAQYC